MSRKPLKPGLLAVAFAGAATAFVQMHSGGMMVVQRYTAISGSVTKVAPPLPIITARSHAARLTHLAGKW